MDVHRRSPVATENPSISVASLNTPAVSGWVMRWSSII